jgi:aldehyde:ferredoxin oxidoreductase
LDLGNMIDDLGLTAWVYDSWYRYLGGLREMGIDELAGLQIRIDDAEWWRDLLHSVAYREGLGDAIAEGLARFYDRHPVGPRYLADFVESAGSRGHGWHREGRAMEPHPSPFWEHSALLYAVSTRDVTPSTHGFFFLNREYGYPSAPKDVSEIPESLLELAERVYGSREAIYPGDAHVEHVTAWHQHRAIIKDSLGLCDWVFPVLRRTHADREALEEARRVGGEQFYGDAEAEARLYRACTGIDLEMAEMERPIAERIVALERCLDVRNHGRSRAADEAVIPHYQWPEKTDGTHLSADAGEFRALLDRYYDLRGWDRETGAPTPDKLRELGLDEMVAALHA